MDNPLFIYKCPVCRTVHKVSPEDWCREQVLFIDPIREKYDFEKWSTILEEYDNIGKYLVTATDVYVMPNLIVTSVIYIRILMEHILM